MFSKSIIDSDAFVSMPMSTQALYFHLAMRADDDGFVDSPRKIMRMVGAADDDIRILIAKRYILAFQSGVIVIKHWLIHNYIRKDRYKKTLYANEKSQLFIKENGAYTDHDGGGIHKSLGNGLSVPADIPDDEKLAGLPSGQPNDNQRLTQVRLGKDRLGKVSTTGKDSTKEAPSDDSIAPAPPPVITMPLNDGTSHLVTQDDMTKYTQLYPAVDVMQELRKMVGWLDANPTRRKTKKGIKRFIASWLAKEQDSGGNRYAPSARPVKPSTLDMLNKMLSGESSNDAR